MTYNRDTLYRHTCRVDAMLGDPELVGDLLLVGIGFARAVDLNDPPFADGNLSTGAIAARVYGNAIHPSNIAHFGGSEWGRRADSRGRHRILDVLRSDIRRYQPEDQYGRVTCGRPMADRDSGRCGRNPHGQHISRFIDPATGLREYVAACAYPAHKAWWTALRERNCQELAAVKVPVPPANRGGVLARHLPEIDWPALYSHLDPGWCPPPEVEAWTPPTLRLVVDTDAPEQSTGGDRPALTLVEGGWR